MEDTNTANLLYYSVLALGIIYLFICLSFLLGKVSSVTAIATSALDVVQTSLFKAFSQFSLNVLIVF